MKERLTEIKRDSVFLVQYDVRQVYSPNLGVFVLDTVSAYHFVVAYKDIISIGKNTRNFNWNASGAALFGGGVLLTTAGLVTWIFAKPNTRYYARPQLVIGAAVLARNWIYSIKIRQQINEVGKKIYIALYKTEIVKFIFFWTKSPTLENAVYSEGLDVLS